MTEDYLIEYAELTKLKEQINRTLAAHEKCLLQLSKEIKNQKVFNNFIQEQLKKANLLKQE